MLQDENFHTPATELTLNYEERATRWSIFVINKKNCFSFQNILIFSFIKVQYVILRLTWSDK